MENLKKTIGIIGGGQLGQMMAISAQYMGHCVVTLDPNGQCSAAKCSDALIVADYDDVGALQRLAEVCDLITYEFENVSAAALHKVEDVVQIPQGIRLLEITQNRRAEKEFLETCGLRIAPWKLIRSVDDLPESVVKKQVLKTSRGGYDGHGQIVVKCSENLREARELAQNAECVLEDFIAFDKEISVVVSGNGREYVTFPVCENEHVDNILHQTIAPARISEFVQKEAVQMALSIAERLGLFGTLCVEMFLTNDGQLYINELAPRPHNSGHYTIEACDFSQFDLHVKGILGEELPQPRLLKNAMMLNLLGQHVEAADKLSSMHPDWHVHDYGKKEAKYNRKMGHVTILTDDFGQTLEEVQNTEIWRGL
ncbi:5-(carboxyamino)imidazole ribonucleotide synthase [Lactovum odontotermitis]